MLDIKEINPEFQKINKTDNCIVIINKNDTKLAITSPVSSIHLFCSPKGENVVALSVRPSEAISPQSLDRIG